MAGAVAVHVSHRAGNLPQAYLYGTAGVRYVLRPENNQRAVACAALGVTGALYQKALTVGRLNGLVSRENLRAGANAVTDNADCSVFRIDFQRFVYLMIYIRDHKADRMSKGGAHKLRQIAGRRGFFRRRAAFLRRRSHGSGSQSLHNFFHDVIG